MQSVLASDKTKKIFYTVRPGDTLSEIAVKFRTSVKKIKTWNGIRNDMIYVGKKLTIHVPVSYKESNGVNTSNKSLREIVYIVKRGDSLSRISYKYGVSIKNIKKWNNIKGTNIRIGDKLIIYTKY